MKTSITHYFPLLLAVLCTCSGITILFYGLEHSDSVFSDMRQTNYATSIAEVLNPSSKEPLPTLLYIGNSLSTGDCYDLSDLFQLQYDSGTISDLDSMEHTALYLVNVTEEPGESVLTSLSTDDISNLIEFPSKAIYDSDKHLLSFHQNGIYTLYIRLYYDHRPGVLFQCQIPVETR